MLQNAYLDVEIGFDTEENEPSKFLISLIFIRPRDSIFTELPRSYY